MLGPFSRRGSARVGRGFAVAVEAKQVVHGQAARSEILKGCEILSEAVGATLGPRGRNVLIQQQYGGPKISKDGVTVARSIQLKDPLQDLGASLLKEVALNANTESGDGTTTATILASEIFKRGCESLAGGVKPIELLNGIKEATSEVLDYLKAQTIPIRSNEDLYHVARVSANGDEVIGRLISDAISRVGKEGVVTVNEGKSVHHSLTFTEGYEFQRGYLSPYFLTDIKSNKCELSNQPLVLISEDKIDNLRQILPALEHCASENRELLIIADDYDNEVLATLVLNRLRGGLKVCAVKAPSFGEYKKKILSDIAALTNATVLSRELGLTGSATREPVVKLTDLGMVDRVVVGKERCLLMTAANGEAGQAAPSARNTAKGSKKSASRLETHVEAIRRDMKEPDLSEYELNQLKDRLAKLTGGVAVIQIGGHSEVEVGELKDRVEDALNATKSALTGGVLPGGGSALLFASECLKDLIAKWRAKNNSDRAMGAEIVRQACSAPLRKIASNAGYEGSVVAGDLLREGKFGRGLDALTGKYVDMFEQGILDPANVVATSLKDAASVASLMCTTEAAVYSPPVPSTSPAAQTGMPGHNDF